jgi:hypothetical protein
MFFLLGDSPAYEFYVPTFRNTVRSIFMGGVSYLWRWNSVPKRRHVKLRRRWIAQKKEYKTTVVCTYQKNLFVSAICSYVTSFGFLPAYLLFLFGIQCFDTVLGRGSLVGTEWMLFWFESRWRRTFSHQSKLVLGTTQLLVEASWNVMAHSRNQISSFGETDESI